MSLVRSIVLLLLQREYNVRQLVDLGRQHGDLDVHLRGRLHVIHIGRVGAGQRHPGRAPGQDPSGGRRRERLEATHAPRPLLLLLHLLLLGGRGHGPNPGAGGLASRRLARGGRGGGQVGGSLEAGELVFSDVAPDDFVEQDGADDGEVCRFEEDDAGGAEPVVGGKEETKRSEDDERKEVEGRIKVCEAVGRGGFEDVDAVDV